MGGGIGLEVRRHGLAVDRLRSAEVVLADGAVVRCDAQREPDLFWALRGGGGGNFGVVTELEFDPVAVDSPTNYKMFWPWSAAERVVSAWLRWAPFASDDLAGVVNINVADTVPGAEPQVTVAGIWHGRPDALTVLLERFVALAGSAPRSSEVKTRDYRTTIMDWFDCGELTVAEAHTVGYSPQAKLPRYPFALARGAFLRKPLSSDAIHDMLAAFDSHRTLGQVRGLHFLAMGGAGNRVSPDATAFVHRDSLCYAGYSVGIDPDVSAESRRVAKRWVDAGWQTANKHSGGGFSYQNFIDPDIPNWRHSYYGANYDRLRRIRAAYDPGRFFDFPQAID
jgi:FAD/FMN-containing dehydrogenase